MSKFFTWTKGDRTNAAEFLRSSKAVPLEYINAQDPFAPHSGTVSRNRGKRPPPLRLEQNFVAPSNTSSRTSESLALQDAAVRSATTLMTVMNDVLRSPQLSAHFAASNAYWEESVPVYQRPRARTAPSTPLCEAPVSEPVELPASVPGDSIDSSRTHSHTTGFTEKRSMCASPLKSPLRDRPGAPLESAMCMDHTHLHAKSIHDHDYHRPTHGASPPGIWRSPVDTERSTAVGMDVNSKPESQLRPLFLLSPAAPATRSTPSTASPSAGCPNHRESRQNTLPNSQLPQVEAETASVGHASELRSLHEAHVQSLKEAHEKETATYKAYIRLLAQQQSSQSRCEHNCKNRDPDLRNGTNNASAVANEPSERETALRTTISSLEARLAAAENAHTEMLDSFHEAREKVRSLSQREHILNQELSGLRNQMATSNRLAAPYTPTDSGQEGRARSRQKRTVSDLGAVSETAHPLLQQIRDLRKVVSEKDAQIHRLEQRASSQQSQQQQNAPALPTLQVPQVPALMRELDEHKRQLHAARADIDQYNTLLHAEIRRQARGATDVQHPALPEVAAHALAVSTERVSKLRAKAATNAGDGYATLALQGPSMISLLEKELHYCVHQIVMYKLDVKGYRKELKKSQSRIKELEAGELQDPSSNMGELATVAADTTELAASPSSPREMPAGRPNHLDHTLHRRVPSSTAEESIASTLTIKAGLGVSLLDVGKKGRRKASSVGHLTTPSLASPLAPSLPPKPPASKSPVMEPRTPLRIDKDLPDPPRADFKASSPTSCREKNHRVETLRSLSDSVVASFAGEEKLQRWKPGTPLDRIAGSEVLPAMESARTPVAASRI